MFFDAAEDEASHGAALTAAADFAAQPGRMRHAPDGVAFQDETEYGPMCVERAQNGYNSGMGEIFRKVASISPVVIKPALEGAAAGQPRALGEEVSSDEDAAGVEATTCETATAAAASASA